jgi:V8-like Glu-specific endopeptidase
MYHPQLSVADRFALLRRAGGSRVRPNVVMGSDNRQVYYPLGYPWHCIGRIYVWNDASATFPAWTGSGALVGRNVVLTAAHVVPWSASSWKMKFVPAHYDGTSIYGSGFETWVSSARGYENSSGVVGWDMATLRLTQDLGDSFGYFGTKHYTSDWNDEPYWTHCGYAGAISGTRPNWQGGISVDDTDSDAPGLEVEHDGDVTSGDSGGPLFAWWDQGPYIVGTHSGQELEYHFPFSVPWVNVDAGGAALNSLVRWARDNW